MHFAEHGTDGHPPASFSWPLTRQQVGGTAKDLSGVHAKGALLPSAPWFPAVVATGRVAVYPGEKLPCA